MGNGLAEPITRHEGDAIAMAAPAQEMSGFRPDRTISPDVRGDRADERSPNAFLAGPTEPDEGYDLALVDIEAHRADLARDGIAETTVPARDGSVRTNEELLGRAADDGRGRGRSGSASQVSRMSTSFPSRSTTSLSEIAKISSRRWDT